jgi:FAD/FMN-containing dehydrogenase
MNSISIISDLNWQKLNDDTHGALLHVDISDNDILKNKTSNPFELQEHSWGTQSTGWVGAWNAVPNPYVVAARKTQDIVVAVDFAKKNNLKLIVKGTGHDYLGRSNAPDSLLVWTHHMRQIEMQDAFIPKGAPHNIAGIPAVTIEAGARWGEVYQEVTTKHGRYVQGGGCTSVGAVGGFLQGGGFGSFSKKYGLGASNLIEAEVVTANGEILIANAYQNEDLFWALKGGGGGTFGIVSKATLQTHELPNYFGILHGKITAKTDEAFKELLESFINFYHNHLNNEHWGEQIKIKPDNSIDIALNFQGLSIKEAEKIWEPFINKIHQSESQSIETKVLACSANKYWDYQYLAKNHPDHVKKASNDNDNLFYGSNDQNEVLAYWHTFQSRWLPIALFGKEKSIELADVLFEASRHHEFALHFNKGLAGASPEALKRSQATSINPVVLESAALAVFAAHSKKNYSETPDHELNKKRLSQIEQINAAAKVITEATPNSGSYSNESDYFQKNWQQDFWGEHYGKLLQIKKKYDPDNFFNCHHSVGSELS